MVYNFRYPNPVALAKAKTNAIEHFAVVGVLESYTSFLEVLSALMPQYFDGIEKEYNKEIGKRSQLIKLTRYLNVSELSYFYSSENGMSVFHNEGSSGKIQLKDSTIHKMKQLLSEEYEFYDFIRDRFNILHQNLLNGGL